MKKEVVIATIVFLIIGLTLGIVLGSFLFSQPKDQLTCHYYCDYDLMRIKCSSNNDCSYVNGACDLETNNCVQVNANISFGLSNGGEKECKAIGGNWTLVPN